MKTTSIAITLRHLALASFALFTLVGNTAAQNMNVAEKLDGFDAYMAKTLKDWNAPGVGVGIVVNDKLVFAKGYGYPGLREETAVHAAHDEPDRIEYEAVHRESPRACW